MNQTDKVIQMLEKANNGRLDYRNRMWLQKNVDKLNIRVSDFKDSSIFVNMYDIGEAWGERGRILIQRGEEVKLRTALHPEREALLLRKSLLNGYYVYLYTPKNSKGE